MRPMNVMNHMKKCARQATSKAVVAYNSKNYTNTFFRTRPNKEMDGKNSK